MTETGPVPWVGGVQGKVPLPGVPGLLYPALAHALELIDTANHSRQLEP
jgi:hypothetical protein